jgi:hypothetical protein
LTLEGFNEASLVRLRDGWLYCVLRTSGVLHHRWSSDAGRSWTISQPLHVGDSPHPPGFAWPAMNRLDDGTLVLGYGRPGKHLLVDPTGTGEHWQGHLDLQAWELDTQSMMGVPPEQRLRGPTHLGTRYWDSGDYLSVVLAGPREVLVCYDVQNFVENWKAVPVSGVRMVRVKLD